MSSIVVQRLHDELAYCNVIKLKKKVKNFKTTLIFKKLAFK